MQPFQRANPFYRKLLKKPKKKCCSSNFQILYFQSLPQQPANDRLSSEFPTKYGVCSDSEATAIYATSEIQFPFPQRMCLPRCHINFGVISCFMKDISLKRLNFSSLFMWNSWGVNEQVRPSGCSVSWWGQEQAESSSWCEGPSKGRTMCWTELQGTHYSWHGSASSIYSFLLFILPLSFSPKFVPAE